VLFSWRRGEKGEEKFDNLCESLTRWENRKQKKITEKTGEEVKVLKFK
jgi:hypothetical protein